MKTFKFAAAQGEVNVRRIVDLPKDGEAGLTVCAPESGLLIVGHSEQGHHHGFKVDPGVTVLERTKDVPAGMKIFYAILENPSALIQVATAPHEALMLDAGIHEIRISREYDPFAEQARRVTD